MKDYFNKKVTMILLGEEVKVPLYYKHVLDIVVIGMILALIGVLKDIIFN